MKSNKRMYNKYRIKIYMDNHINSNTSIPKKIYFIMIYSKEIKPKNKIKCNYKNQIEIYFRHKKTANLNQKIEKFKNYNLALCLFQISMNFNYKFKMI